MKYNVRKRKMSKFNDTKDNKRTINLTQEEIYSFQMVDYMLDAQYTIPSSSFSKKLIDATYDSAIEWSWRECATIFFQNSYSKKEIYEYLLDLYKCMILNDYESEFMQKFLKQFKEYDEHKSKNWRLDFPESSPLYKNLKKYYQSLFQKDEHYTKFSDTTKDILGEIMVTNLINFNFYIDYSSVIKKGDIVQYPFGIPDLSRNKFQYSHKEMVEEIEWAKVPEEHIIGEDYKPQGGVYYYVISSPSYYDYRGLNDNSEYWDYSYGSCTIEALPIHYITPEFLNLNCKKLTRFSNYTQAPSIDKIINNAWSYRSLVPEYVIIPDPAKIPAHVLAAAQKIKQHLKP